MTSALHALGLARWPSLALSEAAFAARYTALEGGAPEHLDEERVADLFLAFAVAEHVPGAIEAFHATLEHEIAVVHRRFRNAGVTADELRQLLVTRICVGEGSRPPAIASYRGRGSLRSWLRVTAVRALTDVRRAERRREESGTEVDELAGLGASPDIAYLQRRFGETIKQVLQGALARLSSDERALLRQRYVHGLQVEEIASLRGIHRVTASRVLARVHDRLLSLARRALEREAGVELENVMQAVRSGLELSLSRVLAATAA